MYRRLVFFFFLLLTLPYALLGSVLMYVDHRLVSFVILMYCSRTLFCGAPPSFAVTPPHPPRLVKYVRRRPCFKKFPLFCGCVKIPARYPSSAAIRLSKCPTVIYYTVCPATAPFLRTPLARRLCLLSSCFFLFFCVC